MRRGLWYTAAAGMVAVLVGLLGGAGVGVAGRSGVWAGAAVGFAVQTGGFWLLFVWALPDRGALAHGLGMLTRMAVVALVALAALPLTGLPAAPTLLSLVGVFFLTTLLEPVMMRIGLPRDSGPAGRRRTLTTSTER